jgi:hypothetical protein
MQTAMENGSNGALQLARGLGWFSVGLGLGEALMPGGVARMIGVHDSIGTRGTLRMFGLRELANGAAILAQPARAPWLWLRVAGDVMDLAMLGKAAADDDKRKSWMGLAFAAVAVVGVTALDVLAATRTQQAERDADGD